MTPAAEPKPKIPFAKPLLGEEEVQAAARVLRSGWLVQGPEVAAFEAEFASFVGAKQAVAVSSGTAALHLALRALGVGPGDEVIVPSHSFIATANAVRYVGAVPAFADIEGDTYNLDPEAFGAVLSPRTKAILVAHQLGMPADLSRIVAFAKAHGLAVVEDAACAAGSEIDLGHGFERIGKPHGVIACFSFHPRKVITTGEGGMITSEDPALAAKVRSWRQHSLHRVSSDILVESYETLGYNYRMTDVQAAVGREQLRRLPGLVAARREIGAAYQRELAGIPGLRLPREPEFARTNWQSYCVRLPDHLDPTRVMRAMLDRGVPTRPGTMNAHQEDAYAKHEPWVGSAERLRVSEDVRRQGLILPLYVPMGVEERALVVEALRAACRAS